MLTFWKKNHITINKEDHVIYDVLTIKRENLFYCVKINSVIEVRFYTCEDKKDIDNQSYLLCYKLVLV